VIGSNTIIHTTHYYVLPLDRCTNTASSALLNRVHMSLE